MRAINESQLESTQVQPKRWSLTRRANVPLPTWRGWILILLFCCLVLMGGRRAVYPFLAVNSPEPGGLLVIEGWAPSYALEMAREELKAGHYQRICVTGGPLELGANLTSFGSYAEVGAASLIKLGLGTNEVQAVPAPWVRQDRTYTSAVALGAWIKEHPVSPLKMTLVTVGPHARRSRLMFAKALGKDFRVGVVAVPPSDYEPSKWWKSSAGFRNVTGEIIAYLYAKVWFRP